MKQYLAKFEQHLAVERNLSPRTVEAYLRDLRQFSAFLEQDGSVNAQADFLKCVDLLLLRQYLARLHKS